MLNYGIAKKQGLYDPQFEHDSCGVGFVCDIKARSSNKIVQNAVSALVRLEHRGAVGADPKTGDGAGILIQVPDEFLRRESDKLQIKLPQKGDYAVGMVFFPQLEDERAFCQDTLISFIKKQGLIFLGLRDVPVNDSIIGKQARLTRPIIKHALIAKPDEIKETAEFERALYLVRKKTENLIRGSALKQKSFFYITNLSCRTLSYKGLLMSSQLKDFFVDLNDKDMASSFALIHSRYSTNTFPAWDLAQPFRFLAHNGEINTLRGNINWLQSRQGLLKSESFGSELKNIFPIVVPGGSDSATIDNALELLVLSGRSIAHAMTMFIPQAWQQDKDIDTQVRSFYEYHACLMEPWDGPAAMAFTDGRFVGATLDRNGLRPARYIITKDGLVVMASEVGVLDIPAENILSSDRLKPGKMFLIDTQERRIIGDEELKKTMSAQRPYKKWVRSGLKDFASLPKKKVKSHISADEIFLLQNIFGYSREDLKIIIKPMAQEGKEPTGSMGDDTPLAVLSRKPRLLFDYFKQLFAQVTNPAIDPIREELVMTLDTYLGAEKNLLEEQDEHCKRIKVHNPILKDDELEAIRQIKKNGFKSRTISTLFEVGKGCDSFNKALDRICQEASEAINKGFSILILSDRGVNKDYAALPSLLAAANLHHYLVRSSLRTQASIILESAEPREVAHFALLFGYGADCINPYLAYSAIKNLIKESSLELEPKSAVENYIHAVEKGILKVLSKMGISTLQSYRGAQIFEALGLSKEIVDKSFTGTVSRIGGIGFDALATDTINRHAHAYNNQGQNFNQLASGGLYQWRKDGEYHLWNPESVFFLQQAARNNDKSSYDEFAKLVNDQFKNPTTLRSTFKFKTGKSIPIDEVEPASEIVKRFVTGAMSFGSISKGAHETIAIAMNRIGGKSNSGEGGEDPQRFIPLQNGDNLCSATKQVASGRFGVTANYLVNAKDLQIKIAQGAKPGEGGQLPGHKVSEIIARTRYTTAGVTLISPPPHHDIYSIEDLAQLIFDLKNVNPRARISVKLVSEMGVGTIAAGVAKGHADMILISGSDGGTGASPISSIKHAGLPWELGLSETHQTLLLNDLRSRVRLQTDGQMRTGRDVIIAALLGAEEYGFASAVLIVLGCVMLRHCNLNNCSVGIATQDEVLCKRFAGKPEYLENYFNLVAQEARGIMAQLGMRKFDELIGRADLLEINKEMLNHKAKNLDLSRVFYRPDPSDSSGVYYVRPQEHAIDKILDRKLIEFSKDALEKGEPVRIELPINNANRSTAAMLSGEVVRRFGENGLSDGTIHIKFSGAAGQSFGAFLAKGITLELEGIANDYVGKGLSGGKIIIYPPRKATFDPHENIIIGNTTLYGGTSGEAYIRGIAGERFCIRNSGVYAVVEGVGDHGCEYMTGGRVVILGETGRNFAAGMSGGIAYVYDPAKKFASRCNMSMVEFEKICKDDQEVLKYLIANHYKYTDSKFAKMIIDNFSREFKKFIKVMPVEYKKVLQARSPKPVSDLTEVSDG